MSKHVRIVAVNPRKRKKKRRTPRKKRVRAHLRKRSRKRRSIRQRARRARGWAIEVSVVLGGALVFGYLTNIRGRGRAFSQHRDDAHIFKTKDAAEAEILYLKQHGYIHKDIRHVRAVRV